MTCETKLGTPLQTDLKYFCMTFETHQDFHDFKTACIMHAKNIMTFTITQDTYNFGETHRFEIKKDDMNSEPTKTCVVYYKDNASDPYPTVLLRICNSTEIPIIKPHHIFFKPSDLYELAVKFDMMYNGQTKRAIKPTLFQRLKNKFRKKSSPVEYKRTSQTLIKPKKKRFRLPSFSLLRKVRGWNLLEPSVNK